jgi:glutathione S-transferase
MIKLYDFHESGNAYKVRLLLSQLGVPFERIQVNILEGETRTPRFLALNPNHRVPVVEWPDGRCLAESNAILFHFAEGTPLLPEDPWLRAKVLQWMFFEQYSHEPYIAVLRFWHFAHLLEQNREQLAGKAKGGCEALGVMEQHLARHEFFVGEDYSIADISLYAYTHVAPEGGFDLAPYPAVRDWMGRVAAQAAHVRITD